MKKKSYVDVLMAVYNGEKHLEEQINSILNQSYKEVHLIASDDGSRDSSKQKIIALQSAQKGKQTISFIESEKNVGLIGNFSRLMEKSTADYIFFSDQDDVWLENKIATMVKKMIELEEKYSKTMPLLVHSDAFVVDKELKLIASSFWKYAKISTTKTEKAEHALGRQLMQNSITGCTMIINRTLLTMATPLPGKEDIAMHDWWLGLIAAAFGKIATVQEALIFYRQHGNNSVGAKKYGLLPYLAQLAQKNRWQQAENCQQLMTRQASCLLKRYRSLCTKQQQEQLEAFLKYQEASLPMRLSLAMKYGFYKQTPMRTIKELFFKGKMP